MAGPIRPPAKHQGEISQLLIQGSRELADTLSRLRFSAPITHVYNPLVYARDVHEAYLQRFAGTVKRVVFLGMNPGPFGMAQTGVPFGEIQAVTNWLGLSGAIGKPDREHPKRPVTGFQCHRSEVSGKRLWGLFASRFNTPQKFFAEHLVLNYCPLAFMEESGKNRTPDKLTPREKAAVWAACDDYLRLAVGVLRPEWIIGVGDFAAEQASQATRGIRVGKVLHPSPANPAANRDWAGNATRQLRELGVW